MPVWCPVVLVWVVAWPGAPPIMWCSVVVVVVVPSPPVWPPCISLLPKFLILPSTGAHDMKTKREKLAAAAFEHRQADHHAHEAARAGRATYVPVTHKFMQLPASHQHGKHTSGMREKMQCHCN